MPSIPLRSRVISGDIDRTTTANYLPTVLRTPSGLAILEVQGTIHAPFGGGAEHERQAGLTESESSKTPIGKLEFPLLDPVGDPNNSSWMKRVYLYVGKHQRLTGEVKKLAKPVVVISKRAEGRNGDLLSPDIAQGQPNEELEILEVIRFKILFGGRPEPVGT